MVKVYYGSLQTQSSSMSSVSQSRVSGFQSMISAFSNFASSNGELNGQGYDAARAYASGIMIPYYQACILYSEGVADAANTLADDYSAKCGAEDLDEEKLRAEIESASRGCMALSASISGIRSKSKPSEGDSERIGRLESQLAAAEARIRETQEKLDNLLEFSSQSQMACNAANRYWLDVSKGLEGISASFSGGGFAFPSDVSWVDVVAQGWADREITLANAYTTAMEKVYNGEDLTETDLTAIERYAAEYPGYVDTSVLAHVQEVRAVKAEEMKYRNLINKAEINGSLSDEEIQTLKEYEQKYPEGILLGQVREVLYDNELRVKKIQKEKEERSEGYDSAGNKSEGFVTTATGVINAVFEHGGNIGEAIGEAGKWALNTSAQKISRLTSTLTIAAQNGENGFTMLNAGSRLYRNSYQAAARMSKIGGALAKVGKFLDNPITKTVGFALGVSNDILNEGKTVGQAVVHTGASTVIGLAASAVTSFGIGLVASTPVGWAGLATFAAGYAATKAFDWVYENNIGGARDALDNIGKSLDDAGEKVGNWLGDRVSDVGQAISGGLASLNPFAN